MCRLRLLLVVPLALAAACSSSGPARRLADDDWKQVQRERLRTQRRSELQPLAQDPQDPRRHIDQIEPSRRRAVRPQSPNEPWVARLGVGVGRLAFDAEGPRFKGDDTLTSVVAIVEPAAASGNGPGLRLEAYRTGRDLFDGETMNDGQSVVPASARAEGLDAFPHYVFQPRSDGDLDFAVRVGPFVDVLELYQASDVRRTWQSIGGRVELEPSWTLWQGGGNRLDVRGLLGGDVGAARFREHFVGGSDDDTTLRLMGEVGVGLLWSTPSFVGELGYRFRAIDYDGTETDLFGDPSHTSVLTNTLFLDAGVRF
jgi:hypothetical protein